MVFSALPPKGEAAIAEKEIAVFSGVTRAASRRGPNVLVAPDPVGCLLAAAFDEAAKARVGDVKIRFVHDVHLPATRRKILGERGEKGNEDFTLAFAAQLVCTKLHSS